VLFVPCAIRHRRLENGVMNRALMIKLKIKEQISKLWNPDFVGMTSFILHFNI
jgi:hypothetical protein